jgi:hypothetical protein
MINNNIASSISRIEIIVIKTISNNYRKELNN